MKIINSQQAFFVSGGTLASDQSDYKIFTFMGSVIGAFIGMNSGYTAGGADYCYLGGFIGVLIGSTIGYATGAGLYGFNHYTIAASDNMFKPTQASLNNTVIIAN